MISQVNCSSTTDPTIELQIYHFSGSIIDPNINNGKIAYDLWWTSITWKFHLKEYLTKLVTFLHLAKKKIQDGWKTQYKVIIPSQNTSSTREFKTTASRQ